jgi:hypothetical protein
MLKIRPSVDIDALHWDENGTVPKVPTAFGYAPAYRPWRAVQLQMQSFYDTLNKNVWEFLNEKQFHYQYSFNPLDMMCPPIKTKGGHRSQIWNDLQLFCENHIRAHLKKLKDDPQLESDLDFLRLLGTMRNYKTGCPICLENSTMGVTCGCGYTEITIFRPCGHSMCAKTCFKNFATSALANNQVSLSCPMCRANISSILSPENMRGSADPDFKSIAIDYVEKNLIEINKEILHK